MNKAVMGRVKACPSVAWLNVSSGEYLNAQVESHAVSPCCKHCLLRTPEIPLFDISTNANPGKQNEICSNNQNNPKQVFLFCLVRLLVHISPQQIVCCTVLAIPGLAQVPKLSNTTMLTIIALE